MLLRTIPTTPLQIICQSILLFQIIDKSINITDEFQEEILSINGLSFILYPRRTKRRQTRPALYINQIPHPIAFKMNFLINFPEIDLKDCFGAFCLRSVWFCDKMSIMGAMFLQMDTSIINWST